MCLGSEADKPIDARKQMFAPFYLLEAAKKATIVVGDSVRPLILHEKRWWMQNRRMLVTVFHCHPWRVSLF